MHLLLVLRVSNKKFARLKVTASPPNLGGLSPPFVTLTSGFSRPPARPPLLGCPDLRNGLREGPVFALLLLLEDLPLLRVVSNTNTQETDFRPPNSKLVTFWTLHQAQLTQFNSIQLYRLARQRARWYQFRGPPVVGPECVCPQCIISSFVVTRGRDMTSAVDLPVCITISQKLTRNANNDSGPP